MIDCGSVVQYVAVSLFACTGGAEMDFCISCSCLRAVVHFRRTGSLASKTCNAAICYGRVHSHRDVHSLPWLLSVYAHTTLEIQFQPSLIIYFLSLLLYRTCVLACVGGDSSVSLCHQSCIVVMTNVLYQGSFIANAISGL